MLQINRTLTLTRSLISAATIALIAAAPATAQQRGIGDDERAGRTSRIQPYIEVNQVLGAELTPGDEIVTFTQIAAGVDLNTQGRNSGASVSLRYERNIGYGDALDTDTFSGLARGSLAIVPRALTLEAGGLASRTRIDGGGGITANPLVAQNNQSQIYSVYAGPSLATTLGALEVTGSARAGYNRIEANNALSTPDPVTGEPVLSGIDIFDESTLYAGNARIATRPGNPLPIGLGVEAGGYQEDVSNLDQRIRDLYARADATLPVTDTLALVGSVGYEDVEVSSRDALRDADGNPVIGDDGRLVTDDTAPRQIAFDVDGLIWDAGVSWRPSSRTELSARVGRRYASTTYFGNFSYAPSERSVFAINVYDGFTSFGGALTNSLSGIGSDFDAARNALTGDFNGLITGAQGASALGLAGSIRSAAFRGRGGQASYQRQIGRLNAAIAAGYDRRTFVGAPGTVLETLDGVRDESYYVTAALSRPLGRSASIATNAYANWLTSELNESDVRAYGASAAYNRALTTRLSARAAVALDYIDSDFSEEDFATATALVGLRYDF